MLAAREPGKAAWLLSLLLHAGLLAVLWWSAAPAVLQAPPPLAVELWAGGGSIARSLPAASTKPVAAPAAVSKPQPPAVAPVAPPQVPQLPAADITLKGGKPLPKPQPQPAAPAKSAKKVPPAATEPVKPQPPPASTKPGKAAPVPGDDLLAGLDELPPGPGKGKVTQAGGKLGVQGGSVAGVADLRAQYVEAVRNRIRPYVMVPDGISGNPQAVVEVEILPTMEIRSSRLLRSSGNSAYDQAVLAALREARRFPALPKGAEFADFRRITLNFRPKE